MPVQSSENSVTGLHCQNLQGVVAWVCGCGLSAQHLTSRQALYALLLGGGWQEGKALPCTLAAALHTHQSLTKAQAEPSAQQMEGSDALVPAGAFLPPHASYIGTSLMHPSTASTTDADTTAAARC